MRRRRQRIYVGTTIPVDQHVALVQVADDLDLTVADVLRELVAELVQAPTKRHRIRAQIEANHLRSRDRETVDVDDESA